MMALATTLAFILCGFQLYLGYRVNELNRRDIYRTNKRISLNRLNDSLLNAKHRNDELYVKNTIAFYYVRLVIFYAIVLCVLVWAVGNKV